MKLYYYAFSGHKWGLDRVRRGVALIKALRDEGIEMQLIVNDFRAGLVAKELGVRDAVTVETIMDIDVIAQIGDAVFLDTPEEDHGRIEKYAGEFATLFHVVDSSGVSSEYGEVVMSPVSEDFSSIIIDKEYFKIADKVERRLFFFGDSDYGKQLLSNADFFAGEDMELLLGNYFFVKYEDDLAEIFSTLHEPEEYTELVTTSSSVVTASIQTALEARAAEADVIYLSKEEDDYSLLELLKVYGINIIDGFNKKELLILKNKPMSSNHKVTKKSEDIALFIKKRLSL